MGYETVARWYDRIYRFKDYWAEAVQIREIVARHGRSGGRHLLDVACGTGMHLGFLREWFQVAGLEHEPAMLAIARDRLPGVPLFQGDMVDFDLGQRFDAITCLFSSIGYVETAVNLRRAVAAMARHLAPGGVLIVESSFTPEKFIPGYITGLLVDDPDLKIARLTHSRVEGDLAVICFEYLVATAEGIEHHAEEDRLALFRREDYLAAFESAGLETAYDAESLTGRGVYIGVSRHA